MNALNMVPIRLMRFGCAVSLLLLNLFVCTSHAISQNNPYKDVNIVSPTAASLAKYGDIPVSYHTGIPQISIPVYTVNEGMLSLPISLSYHASGLKVMESASWVGAGWSLNAGGVITRTVIGGVDEIGTGGTSNQTHGHFSHYGYNKYLFVQATGSNGNGIPLTNDNMYPDDLAFTDGRKDGEPDLFFFNLGGYAGKFYFHDDRSIIIVPQQDIKIEPIAPNDNSLTGFIVTIPDGTKYYFGKNQTPENGSIDAVEFTSSYNPSSPSGVQYAPAASAWHLTKISSADNQFSINLEYEAEKYGSYTIASFPLPYTNADGKEYSLVKNFMKGVRLKKINFSNGKVELLPGALREDLSNFNPAYNTIEDLANTEAKALGEIKITDNGQICKKIKFTQSYFVDNTTPLPSGLSIPGGIESDKKRLKLDEVQEMTCDEQQKIPPHTFTYYTEKAPRQLTFARDHWGFYNGATSNYRLIPTYTINDYDVKVGADRDAKWPEMRGGTLQQITYPTGGSTSFEYEANTTWLSYTDNIPTFRFSTSVGYDGSSQMIYNDKVFSANPYQIKLSNSACQVGQTNCSAAVSVQNSTGGASCNGGETVKTYFTTTPGIHQIIMTKTNANSSFGGAQADFTELVPTNVQKNEIVGGLRIKKIINFDGIDIANNIVKNYEYADATGNSSGILYSRPTYVQVIRNDVLRDIGTATIGNNIYAPNGCVTPENAGVTGITLFYQVSPNPIRPMETTQGNHIGYNEVKVTQVGNGKSVYRFYGSNIWDINHTDVCIRKAKVTPPSSAANPSYPYIPESFEYMRGELKEEEHYNQNGQLLKSTLYVPSFTDNPTTTPAIKYGSANNVYIYTAYELRTKRKTQVQVTETNLVPGTGNYLQNVSTTYFESPYHNQAVRTTTTNSKGETIESKQKYSFDFRVPACEAIATCLPTYQTAATSAYSTFTGQLPCASGSWNCKFVLYQQYRRDLSIARSNYVSCRRTNFTDPVNLFATTHDNAKTAADAVLKPVLEMQDKYMNFPIESTSWKNGKLLSATYSQFDYNAANSTNIYPATLLSTNLASPALSFSAATINSNTITRDSRYAIESAMKFANGNPSEVKLRSGVTSSYVWGYNNTLPIVKAVGVDYATLKAAYDAVSGNLVQLRLHPSLSGALLNTYSYAPLQGMVTETDANGKTISYEFDNLWRLKLIRNTQGNIVKTFDYQYKQPQ